MKQISDLMPLATLGDLRTFCIDYARKDKKFNKELTAFLNERFIDDDDSAADFIARLEDASFSFAPIVVVRTDSECKGTKFSTIGQTF